MITKLDPKEELIKLTNDLASKFEDFATNLQIEQDESEAAHDDWDDEDPDAEEPEVIDHTDEIDKFDHFATDLRSMVEQMS